jgi:PAS domain S-box-containing protein
MSESKSVCVLLVEDKPDAVQRVQVCLRQFKEIPFEVVRSNGTDGTPQKTVDSRARNMNFEVTTAISLADALAKIADFHFDIVLLDLNLPDTQGLPAIRTIKQAVDSVPIVVLIDNDDDNVSQTTLKAGAKGHIIKDDAGYESLVRIIRYVLHRADVETRNQLLVAALEATSNAIIITDRDVRIEWINPAFTELTGYSFQESLGRRPIDLFKSGVHDPEFYAQMWQKLMNGEHWQGEIINKHKDGSFYNADVGISPVRNRGGSLTGYVQIQRDITDSVVRLTISEILQQPTPLKERFGQVLDILFKLKSFDLQRKGGVFLRAKNEDHLQLYVLNGAFSAEFIEKEQCVKCCSCLCGRVAVTGKLLVSDDCFCDPRHEHQFSDMQVHGHYILPIMAGAEVLGVLFLYTDPYPLQSESRLAMLSQVGEMMALALRQEEAKTALEKARDMAMQASIVKSEFLANMSHEIRTPMNGVLGMLDLLQDTKLTTTQKDWVNTAHSSAEALLDIINDILDFSKLEAGKFEVEKVEFNLVDLVDDICALLAVRAYAKGLELNCSLPVPMPLVWRGDPMRIRQVLTNLLGNAVKFTEQGEVNVNVSLSPLSDTLDELRFEVHDTGIGVSNETQNRLFNPFSQADGATSRRFGGSGLGLSISKKLVELMGGTIGINSILGEGSCFWFTLPLEHIEHGLVSEKSYDFAGKRALIVDDNATNRNILNTYLNSWGLQVNEVDNGSTGLMHLQTLALQGITYDLILLDVQMPIMDGLTLAKCLAQIPTLAKIPVILISSGDQFDLEDYANTAIVQRLLKPVRQLQLFDVVANALQCKVATANKPAEPAIELPSYKGKRVLVVEDNKINQKVIIAKLGKFDLEPDVAENGQIALSKLAKHTYDLIFMDCQMPVMDGYTATQELRLMEMEKGLPHQTVIALTANALEGEREKCLAAGMDDYLTKPIVSEALLELLAASLGPSSINEVTPELSAQTDLIKDSGPIWNETNALNQLDGDRDLLYDMVGLFLTEAPKQLAALSKAKENGDLMALFQLAHAVKGTLGHFCADYALACASLLEQTARNGETAGIQKQTEDLLAALSALIHHLSQAQNA